MEITYETRKIEMVWDVAVRLEMVLGVPAKFWNKLESTYREKLVKANAENDMDADKELAKKYLIVKCLKMVGFLRPEIQPKRLFILEL